MYEFWLAPPFAAMAWPRADRIGPLPYGSPASVAVQVPAVALGRSIPAGAAAPAFAATLPVPPPPPPPP
ncbi:MAG: hypothetical protein IPN02_05970 [Candidatus Microthrix sp.]|uniref:Uncharacterized protein n=1 Tax=Candidatus Neomicrothrix subdominans TaxID=2954438 RepID=A0A936NB44_9ACTN|nr:hypothetical protein [Candidatus Microthrix subdominans]